MDYPDNATALRKNHANNVTDSGISLAFVIVVSLLCVSGPTFGGEPKLSMYPRLVVIDAKQRLVGIIAPTQNLNCYEDTVVYKAGGRIFSVSVNKSGFPKCPGYYFFESSDCSGTPFVQVYSSRLIESARVDEPGSTVYLPDLDELRQYFQSHSSLTNLGVCFAVDNMIEEVAPEIAVINLDTRFTSPFKIR